MRDHSSKFPLISITHKLNICASSPLMQPVLVAKWTYARYKHSPTPSHSTHAMLSCDAYQHKIIAEGSISHVLIYQCMDFGQSTALYWSTN